MLIIEKCFLINPFNSHLRRREKLREVSERLVKKWSPTLTIGDYLCNSCLIICYDTALADCNNLPIPAPEFEDMQLDQQLDFDELSDEDTV